MDATKRYAIDSEQISHNDFDGEIVVIHFQSGNYFSLRGTAATLWKHLCLTPVSPSALLGVFTDPPAEAGDEITAFCEDLLGRGVLREADVADTTAESLVGASSLAYGKPEVEAFDDLQTLLIADVIHDTDEQGWPNIAAEPAA